jgi:hypothetical protein
LPKLLPPFFAKLLAYSGNVYRGAPLVGVARKILVAGTKFSETSMTGPWGVLLVGPAAATTGVGDVDGGPPWGLLLGFLVAATTKVGDVNGGALGVLSVGPAVATTGVGDIDGGPPGGCCRQSGSGYHQSWRRRWWAP